MRRDPYLRPENQLAGGLDDIERLKEALDNITDGRNLSISSGSSPGSTTPPFETSKHIIFGSKHSKSLRVTDSTALDVAFDDGQVWSGGSFYDISAGTLTLDDDATNYVFVSSSGVVAYNVVSFPSDSVPLSLVVTVGGDIISVSDRRSYLSASVSVSGSTHDADQIIDANSDTSVEVERTTNDDIIRLKAGGTDVASIGLAGQWLLPVTGSGAGLLLGGDALLYRTAANVLRTPDALVVDDYIKSLNFFWASGGAAGTKTVAYYENYDDTLGVSGVDFRVKISGSDWAGILWNKNAAWNSGSAAGDKDTYTSFSNLVDGSGVEHMRLAATGQLQLPVQGSDAGILLGGDVHLYRSNANELYINDDVVIPDTRRLIIGNDVSVSFGGDVSLAFLGTGAADTRMGFGKWSDDPAGASLVFLKSRDPVIGSQTIVQDDDVSGGIVWSVDDGVNNSSAIAWLFARVEGAPAVGDTPGQLIFYTTSVGSITPSAKMSISPAGMVRLNIQGPTGGLRIGGDVNLYRASGSLLGTGHAVIGDGVGSSASRPILNVTATSNPVGRSMIESHIRSATTNNLIYRLLDTGEVTIFGDLLFENNGSGLPYGCMHGYNISETVAVGVVDTWYELAAGLVSVETNLMTFQNNHELEVVKAGRYVVNWSASVQTTGANDEVEGSIAFNGTADTTTAAHVTMVKSNAAMTLGGGTVVDLAAGDVISIAVLNHTTNRDIIVEHITVTVVMVGGT